MPREHLSALQIAVVSTLPAASTAPRCLLSQGGRLWFSDGTNWFNLGAFGGSTEGSITVGTTAPSSPAIGHLWVDTN